MREFTTDNTLRLFMEQFAAQVKGPGIVYLTGGATAIHYGIRQRTIDIDIKLEPEPKGAFEAIAEIKDKLNINIELAAPDQFIPPLPGWRERSEFIIKINDIEYKHYDIYSQILSKIERGHDQDRTDIQAYVRLKQFDLKKLNELFNAIRPQLIKYPAISASDFEAKVTAFIEENKR